MARMPSPRSAGLCIASGSTYPEFAEQVAGHLDIEVSPVERRQFKNGELYVRYGESIRGQDVFVIQSHHKESTYYSDPEDRWSVNQAIQEQVLMLDAAGGSSAQHVTAVCPLIGYSRQDKKDHGREAIAAKTVVRQLQGAGAERVISFELHAPQEQGFTLGNDPYENLFATKQLVEPAYDWAADKEPGSVAVATPDVGSVKRAKKVRQILKDMGIPDVGLVIINKDRADDSSHVEVGDIVGDVEGKHLIFAEDMFDTCGTLKAAIDLVRAEGSESAMALGTHGIFSGEALDRLNSLKGFLQGIVVANTVNQDKNQEELDILKVVDVTEHTARTIWNIHYDQSVSALF